MRPILISTREDILPRQFRYDWLKNRGVNGVIMFLRIFLEAALAFSLVGLMGLWIPHTIVAALKKLFRAHSFCPLPPYDTQSLWSPPRPYHVSVAQCAYTRVNVIMYVDFITVLRFLVQNSVRKFEDPVLGLGSIFPFSSGTCYTFSRRP